MAAGGRIFPSATGGGLGRAGANIAGAVREKAARDISDARFAAGEARLDTADARAARADAVNRIQIFSSYMDEGALLGDQPDAFKADWELAFGVSADETPELPMKAETLNGAIQRAGIDLVGSPEGSTILNQAVRSMLGLEPDADVANSRNAMARLNFAAVSEAIADPAYITEYMSNVVIQDQTTPILIPNADGTTTEVVLDSPTAAQIYASLLQQNRGFSAATDKTEVDAFQNMLDQIREAVGKADFEVSENVLRNRVIPKYDELVTAVNTADTQEEMIAAQKIRDDYYASASQGEQLAMDYLLTSVAIGQSTWMANLPPQLRTTFQILQELGANLPKEEVARLAPSVLRAMGADRAAQIVDPPMQAPFIDASGQTPGIGSNLFGFGRFQQGVIPGAPGGAPGQGGLPNPPAPGTGAGIDPGSNIASLPEDIQVEAAAGLLTSGAVARADLVLAFGEDIVTAAEAVAIASPSAVGSTTGTPVGAVTSNAIPEGGTDPQLQTNEAAKAKARQLNQQIIRLASPGLGLDARRTLQISIDRLRNELGIAGGR